MDTTIQPRIEQLIKTINYSAITRDLLDDPNRFFKIVDEVVELIIIGLYASGINPYIVLGVLLEQTELVAKFINDAATTKVPTVIKGDIRKRLLTALILEPTYKAENIAFTYYGESLTPTAISTKVLHAIINNANALQESTKLPKREIEGIARELCYTITELTYTEITETPMQIAARIILTTKQVLERFNVIDATDLFTEYRMTDAPLEDQVELDPEFDLFILLKLKLSVLEKYISAHFSAVLEAIKESFPQLKFHDKEPENFDKLICLLIDLFREEFELEGCDPTDIDQYRATTYQLTKPPNLC